MNSSINIYKILETIVLSFVPQKAPVRWPDPNDLLKSTKGPYRFGDGALFRLGIIDPGFQFNKKTVGERLDDLSALSFTQRRAKALVLQRISLLKL